MAFQVYTSIPYGIARLSIWFALLVVAILDGVRNRQVKSKGWQLYYMLVAGTSLFVVRNLFFLGICIEGENNDGWAKRGTYGAYIFFADVAEAFWIFVLLAISSGFCITRSGFGPHKAVCIIIPTIFLVTSFVVDYILFAQVGLDAFNYKNTYASSAPPDPEEYDPATDPLVMEGTSGFLFVFCIMANSMAFFMSWFYMYDTARSEWQTLQDAGADPSDPPRFPTAGLPASSAADGVGHSAMPGNLMLLEEGANASHLYGDVVVDDLDAPKTVQDRIADHDKARLMKHFFLAVSIYIITAVVVFFVPIFVPMAVDAALLVLYDTILWIFSAGLLFVFRMRASNQFLLLTEDGVAGGETTTELGVMYHEDDNEGMNGSKRIRRGVARGWAPEPAPVAARYTLGEEEAGDGIYGGATPRSRLEDGGEVNASAALHGVVIRPLPSQG